ncbi:Npun_F0494 family protein [Calothrix rhizosoleniae]|uniref:Npun_F0494 family protein n=1 Tax=Calothrix rhizosoleniae TaxID=888997 RepID=UPI000B49B54F|nr:Npun_F0494 family protein [Calothrix rhizosoleniae]
MPDVDSQPTSQSFSYSHQIIKRAERSLLCSPFHLSLFTNMACQSVPMNHIALDGGITNGYTKRSLSELAVDDALVWLIDVGLLRREVDGQGITDGFRLTPLGRQVVEKLQNQPHLNASWSDRIKDTFIRWFRLPF